METDSSRCSAHTEIFVTNCRISFWKMETLLTLCIALTFTSSVSPTATTSPSFTTIHHGATHPVSTTTDSDVSLSSAAPNTEPTTHQGPSTGLHSVPSTTSHTATHVSMTTNSTEQHTTVISVTGVNSTHVTSSSGNGSHVNATVTTSTGTVATGNSSQPASVSPDEPITSSRTTTPAAAGSGGVPGWGIALLVLAALILLLLILLLIALVVWWCCCRGRHRGLTHRDDIPLYTTHSHFQGPNGRPYEELDKPVKNRTGLYTVNQ